ncbi:helix-turn-helix transcriptional regulator [Nocardia sp. CA-290969]|uniref:helix-turn-helix transcriptional regulator n=1 Tax=Nocardia sp. CA-290969 TaxID=3239986 RepID=UPI003D89F47D
MIPSVTGEGPAKKLVGRTSELADMADALACTRTGSALAVAIVGEPGIGKTCLLGALCRQAGSARFGVLAGRGSEFEAEVPFGLVIDALDEYFAGLEAEVVADLGPGLYAELAVVLPSLAGRGDRLAGRSEIARFEFYRAVRAVFERIARTRPLVLALDDVHWADPASVELIGYLLRRPVPGMLVALSYRPRRAPRLLLTAVEQGVRDGVLHELGPAPLTVAEAAELLGQRPNSATTRSLHAESGGNPFYLEQLARISHGRPPPPIPQERLTSEHRSDIPDAVRAALGEELAVLGSDTREVLQAAAVAGDPFNVELVAQISAADQTTVLEHIDALAAAELVCTTDVAGRLRFRHPIVRRVVYDGASPGWLFGAHRRAADALERSGAPLGLRAHHVAHSATTGDKQAVAVLTAAGEAAVRAPAAAADWFATALRLLPESTESERRLHLTISLADALAAAGRLRDSRAVLESALKSLPADSAAVRTRIIGMLIRADHGLGRAEEARNLITAALGRAPAGSVDAVTLSLDLAENHLMMARWVEAVQVTTAARREAKALGDPTLGLVATAAAAWFRSLQGADSATQDLIDEAAVAIDARDVDLTPALVAALADLTLAELAIDRLREADRHAERGLRVCRTAGHGYLHGRFALAAATAKLFLGQLSAARSAAETAVEVAVLLDNDQLLSAAEGMRCWIETARGDLPEALAAGNSAVHASDRRPNALFAWVAHACYGEALIEAGELDRGSHEIRSIGGPGLAHIPPSTRSLWQRSLVTAELAGGRIHAAEDVARHMDDAGSELNSNKGNANYAWAQIYLARHDFRSAALAAHRAVRCFEDAEMRVWGGRARLVAGRAHALADDRAAAVTELELAHSILHDAGAERWRDEAAKELRSIGIRVRRRSLAVEQADPSILSDREQGIAERVAQGYTNREIGAELFVSPKTVEKHLARVFTKLGITSRAGVAAALAHHQKEPRQH